MILINLALFVGCLFVLIKSADFASRYSSRLARKFHMSEFIVSFFVVAVISALPEASISIISAIEGIPEFGLGTIFGSNIADLALVFGLVALISEKGVSVKSEILKKDFLYLALLLFPVLLGIDGYYSRIDGALLLLAGCVFFFTLSIESKMFKKKFTNLGDHSFLKNLLLLIASLAALAVAANYTIEFGVSFANEIGIAPILVGLIMVSLGTCLPELSFSIRAVRTNHDQLALGDILGTVITDATIVVGLMALIHPFTFKISIIYITGVAMFMAGLLAVIFITSEKKLTKREGIYLVFFYIFYLVSEIIVGQLI